MSLRTILRPRRARTSARSTAVRISSACGWAVRVGSFTSSTREGKRCRRTYPDCRRTGETALVLRGHTRRRLTVRIPVALIAVLALLLGQSATAGPAAASQLYPESYHRFGLTGGGGTTARSAALTPARSGVTAKMSAASY